MHPNAAEWTCDHASDLAFCRGAGDENRTRTISLGNTCDSPQSACRSHSRRSRPLTVPAVRRSLAVSHLIREKPVRGIMINESSRSIPNLVQAHGLGACAGHAVAARACLDGARIAPLAVTRGRRG
jgi:hypothetical protein